MASCVERFGDTVEGFIASSFHALGLRVGNRPRWTILLSFVVVVIMGAGFATWETENRADELWVPQNTIAELETEAFQSLFPTSTRFNQAIVQARNGENVLEKERLLEALAMHQSIQEKEVSVDGESFRLEDVCFRTGGACVSRFDGVCSCLMTSIFKQWNYDLEMLENDENYMSTLREYGSREDLEAVLGLPIFDEDGQLVSAQAFSMAYFLEDRSKVIDGSEVDEIGETWEEMAFLNVVSRGHSTIQVDYLAARSFGDEFGDAISGDVSLVQISYVVAFLFLGANLGKVKCGTGSRWTLTFGALMVVGLSTAAGFGLSSLFGLFFGPVHSLLPFILLGIGIDDAFVIVNAFNRERKGPRSSEDNDALRKRRARALARAGASITVTSATDIVAFGISASSSLPALSSFCAYAAISIFFLWAFASTFFTATVVLDERRQRDNRRECLCCLTRKNPIPEEEDSGFEEDCMSAYFRKYHAPAILSKVGKAIVLLIFSGLFAFGMWGALNLDVEDTQRNFIPEGSYINGYIAAADEFFPNTGIDLFIVFEGGSEIYESRQQLANLDERIAGKSSQPPFIAEPDSAMAYQNVMAGFSQYLNSNGTGDIGGAALGDDSWPTTEEDFISTLLNYTSSTGPGARYNQDVSTNEDAVAGIRVQLEYVRLTKESRGRVIDDADRQIQAMDATRDMINSWNDLPSAFPYSQNFLSIEGFKIIRRELFLNVGLAILAVGVIVLVTVASPMTAALITISVGFCIIEILGFMYVAGIAIDSVSVINIVLAVGLSVDYSAHVGHCFMTKPGDDKDQRAMDSLADIGAAVLNGAISTFLAVVVLLFSTSYVFRILSQQFALTVALGIVHGLILLPVLLSIFGPKPFASTGKKLDDDDLGTTEEVRKVPEEEDGSDTKKVDPEELSS